MDRPAPDFTLATADGRPVQLSQLRGKPVMLNFWATWCGPCKEEMPLLDQTYLANRESGLQALAINVMEKAPVVQKFAKEARYNLTFVVDAKGQALSAYDVSNVPVTIFIDADGIVRDIYQGGLDRRLIEQKLARILPPPAAHSVPLATNAAAGELGGAL